MTATYISPATTPKAAPATAGEGGPLSLRPRGPSALIAGSLLHHVGKQAEKARPLDCARKLALPLRRDRRDAARHDLAALGDKALQQTNVLVIDLRRVRPRERAGFAPPKERPPGSPRHCAPVPSRLRFPFTPPPVLPASRRGGSAAAVAAGGRPRRSPRPGRRGRRRRGFRGRRRGRGAAGRRGCRGSA